jgi:hypothetical protein
MMLIVFTFVPVNTQIDTHMEQFLCTLYNKLVF